MLNCWIVIEIGKPYKILHPNFLDLSRTNDGQP